MNTSAMLVPTNGPSSISMSFFFRAEDGIRGDLATGVQTCALPIFRLPAKAVEQGLMRAEWPARLQRLTTGRLVSLAPAGAELWLDGGHNADGGRAIAAALGDLEERVSRPLVLVVGMLSNKDHAGFLGNFTGLVRRVFGVPIHQDKGVPAGDIAAAAR